MTPSQKRFGSEKRLVLRTIDLEKFAGAYVPAGVGPRDPDVSALYADLRRFQRRSSRLGRPTPYWMIRYLCTRVG